MKKMLLLVVMLLMAVPCFALNPMTKLNNQVIPLFNGSGDSYAVVKTLTAASQLVFGSGLAQDEVVRFWAEEDFSYNVAPLPTAAVATSHRIPAYTVIYMVIHKNNNMAVIGTGSSMKFYLSK